MTPSSLKPALPPHPYPHPRSCMDDILPALQQGGLQHCTKIITHKLPLKEAVEAYAAFESQATGWVKVCFDPWAS